MCRDDAFRTELLAGAQQAIQEHSSPPPSATSQGQPHRRRSLDDSSAAPEPEHREGGRARERGAGVAASPPPSTSFVPTGPPPPPGPHPGSGGVERQESGEEVRFQPLAKRRLVLPDAQSMAALNVAWTRIASSLPALDRSSAHVQALAYDGIPPALRPQIYFAACGAAAARDVAAQFGLTYDALHSQLAPQFLALSDLNQIDKDVRRTGLKLNASAAAALRRLLRALTLTCPCGYTQSMNSLAALCLVLWPEDECTAFWALFCVVRIIQPAGMYAGALDVPRVAAAAVASAVLRCKPGLGAMLSDEGEGQSSNGEEACGPGSQGALLLSSLILPWLMCCYVGATPLELTLRIWDVLFLVGPEGTARVAASLLLSVADAAAAAGGQAAALGTLSRGVTTELAEVLSPPLIDDIMHRARCLEWPRTGGGGGGGAPGGGPSHGAPGSVPPEQGDQGVRALVADARAHVQRLNAKLDAAGGVAVVAKGAFQGLKARLAKARQQHGGAGAGSDDAAAQQAEQVPPPAPQLPHEACAAALCAVRDRYTAATLRSPCFSALLALAAAQLACEPGLEDAEAGDAACAVPQCLFSGHVDGAALPSTLGTDAPPPPSEDEDAVGHEDVAVELSPEAQQEAHQLLGAPAGAEALRQLRALLDSTL